MLSLSELQLGAQIYAGRRSVVYRGRTGDGQQVVVKQFRGLQAERTVVQRYQREASLAQRLSEVAGVVRVHRLFASEPVSLVMEDAGESLAQRLGAQPLKLEEILSLGARVADVLGRVHDCGVVHNAVNPSNLVLSGESLSVTLIDFSRAFLTRQTEPAQPELDDDTLRYMAPEQTGRVSRAVDSRADLYSLGATLYELLTGHPPFVAEGRAGLIHALLAKRPADPQSINPQVPPVVGRIVLKLLAKDPDERYQSAFGLAADLERCLEGLRAGEGIPEFDIAQSDLQQRLCLPRGIYGREAELGVLLEGLEVAADGARLLQLVSGAAGVGKSGLIEGLRHPTIERGGRFVWGKYDQFKRDVPYSGFCAALGQALNGILTEPPARVSRWKRELGAALGEHVGTLAELLPALKLVLPESQAPQSGAREMAHLVPLLLLKLLGQLASREQPLVLVLEDLQWADPASLQLLEELMRAEEVQGLYLVGSYREHEVDAAHPLMLTRRAIASDPHPGTRVAMLHLVPLGIASVTRLLADALSASSSEVRPLAEIVHQKTEGNPFFVRAFVDALADAGLLRFEPTSRRWKWNDEAVRARRVTDNVVDLLIEKIGRLAARARSLLETAACLGGDFDAATLAVASGVDPAQVAPALQPAIEIGLLVEERGEYRFAHDRVLQAAQELTPNGQRAQVHQALGRRLLAWMSPAQRETRVFELLLHLNFGLGDACPPALVPQLLELNLLAGKKALARAASAAAHKHLEVALALLPADGWTNGYAVTLELHDAAMQAAFLVADYARMDALADAVRRHARTALDQVSAFTVRIAALEAQGRIDEQLAVGRQVLELLGMKLPRRPGRFRVLLGLGQVLWLLRGKTVASLLAGPKLTDLKQTAILEILMAIGQASYLASRELFAVVSLKAAEVSLRFGNGQMAPFSFAGLAVLLCSLGRRRRGNEMADVAEGLFPTVSPGLRGPSRGYVSALVRHWRVHIRDTLPGTLAAIREGTEGGRPTSAALAANFYCRGAYCAGRELGELARECGEYSHAIRRMNEEKTLRYNERIRQVALNLIGQAEQPWVLTGEAFDEAQGIALAKQMNDWAHYTTINVDKLIIASLFREATAGLAALRAAGQTIGSVSTMMHTPLYHFHGALIELLAARDASAGARRSLLRGARAKLQKLDQFTLDAPMNYAFMAELVRAELHAADGRDQQALAAYGKAVALAGEHGYLQHEALAAELCGRFLADRGHEPPARAYLSRARALYERWGAARKVRHLDETLPASLRDWASEAAGPGKHAEGSTILGRQLDAAAAVTASQRLSSEVVLPRLVAQLMELAAQAAGAERCHLVLRAEAGWSVEASHSSESPQAAPITPVALDACEELSVAMVHYALRTAAPLVLADAGGHGDFTNDEYVRRRRPRSVLVVPLLRRAEQIGALYLENNQSAGTFTPERVEVLSLLASQAAISIDNARLYQRLEMTNDSLKRALEQAEDSARAKSEFLANTSHELRTPLNAIINLPEGMLELFEQRERAICRQCGARFELEAGEPAHTVTARPCPDCGRAGSLAVGPGFVLAGDPAELVRHLTATRTAGKHLLAVVNDILDVSKLEAGQMSLTLEETDLHLLIDAAAEIIRPLASQRRLGLKVPAPAPPLVVMGDRQKMTQVVVNLLGNAIKFSAEGGTITVGLSVEPAGVLMSVKDEGIGIDARHHQKVFESFQQIDGGETRKHGGTGLGLAICKKIVELHGGAIWVESAVGLGSTFWVRWPPATTERQGQ